MKTLIYTLLVCVSFIGVPKASASGIPVVDVSNLVQAIQDYANQIEQITNQFEQIQNQVKQIESLKDQYEQQVKEFESMTGSYDMGKLLNSIQDKEARDYIPHSWEDTLAVLEGGGLTGSQSDVQKIMEKRIEEGQIYTDDQLFSTEEMQNSDSAKRYKLAKANVYSTMGISQATFDSSRDRLENIEGLMDSIDTATDPKASQDLQNRIIAENAVLANEMVRQQAVTNLALSKEQEKALNQKASDRYKASGGDFPDWE